MKKLLLIIPAYNEEGSLKRTVDSIVGYDYIVVNDGSTDKTGEICKKNNIDYIELPINEGLTRAFQVGMIYAYRNGYDYALQFDADGQHLPQYIQPLFDKITNDDCDIVIGSRFLSGSSDRSIRQIGSGMIRLSIILTSRKKITDPTSGMRMYNRRMIELFAKNSYLSPEPETMAYLIRNGAIIKEIQVDMAERFAGESYLTSWKAIKYMLRTVMSIMLIQYVRPRLKLERK